METEKEIIELYKSKFLSEKKGTIAVIDKLREDALNDLLRLGFPDKKSEKYKYSFLLPLFENPPVNSTVRYPSQKINIPLLDAYNILLNNGSFNSTNINPYFKAGSIKVAIIEGESIIIEHLFKYAVNEDGFIALNTMFFDDGFWIHIPPKMVLDKPIQLINSNPSGATQRRNLIVIDKDVEVEINLFDFSANDENTFNQNVTEIIVGQGARLSLTMVQNFGNQHHQISHVFIHQLRQSSVNTNIVSLAGPLIRNNIYVILNEQGAEHKHNNLFIADQNSHVDNYTFINHAKPFCNSNQLIKGILKDKATGAFNGKILVSRDAQKTVAFQKNNNLLLDSQAVMNTRPQLEIYADDVKCSHGATVGQLDNEALFYMRSRGIGEQTARALLIRGFANEILESISNEPCKEILMNWVMSKLNGSQS